MTDLWLPASAQEDKRVRAVFVDGPLKGFDGVLTDPDEAPDRHVALPLNAKSRADAEKRDAKLKETENRRDEVSEAKKELVADLTEKGKPQKWCLYKLKGVVGLVPHYTFERMHQPPPELVEGIS